jgi:hypothetical protein
VSFRQACLRGAQSVPSGWKIVQVRYTNQMDTWEKGHQSGRASRKLSDRGTPGLERFTASEGRSGGEVAPTARIFILLRPSAAHLSMVC